MSMSMSVSSMDISRLSKLTVPVLKKELKDRGLPLGGLKTDLVARLHQAIQQQQQPSAIPQQQAMYSQTQLFNLPLLTTNITSPLTTQPPAATPAYSLPHTPSKPTSKVVDLMLGYVDPRDKFGAVVNVSNDNQKLHHEGYVWGFYCTKSMDYQVWTTVYLKCVKAFKDGNGVKKRVLDEAIPSIEAVVEFPSGKKMKGVLTQKNGHRFYVMKDAQPASITKTYGGKDEGQILNVKVTLRTLAGVEAHQAEHQPTKKQKTEANNESNEVDWGIYGQMDSDDEDRSEFDTNSDYSSSESEPE